MFFLNNNLKYQRYDHDRSWTYENRLQSFSFSLRALLEPLWITYLSEIGVVFLYPVDNPVFSIQCNHSTVLLL